MDYSVSRIGRMPRRRARTAVLCLLVCQSGLPNSAVAQIVGSDFNPIERERERQEREEQVREIERRLEETEARTVPPAKPQPILRDDIDFSADMRVEVSDIIVDQGEDRRLDFSRVVEPYAGRTLDNAALFELVRDASKLLHDAGYVTSMITIRPQNLSSGTLVLRVNWGRVRGWLVDGVPITRARHRRMLAAALPLVEGRLLNIRDIDQIVENMNTPGKSVKVKIVAAEEEGASYLDIQIRPTRDPSATLSINGGGRTPFGEGRDIYSASWRTSDLDGLNDVLAIDVASRYYDGLKENNYLRAGVNYEVPIGYTKLGVGYGYSRYEREIVGKYGSYSSNGDSHNIQANIETIIYRRQAYKWSLYGQFNHEIGRNYIEGERLDVNSRNYSALKLGIRHSGPYLGGYFFADASVEAGLGAYNASRAAFNVDGNERHFRRLLLNAGWSTNFKLASVPLSYSARVGLQYSDRLLLDRYRFGIGDDFTVRGFENTPLRGDIGGYISSTLSSAIPFGKGGPVLTPLIGLDFGGIRYNDADSQQRYIAAAALGARFNWRTAYLGVTYGRPLLITKGRPIEGLIKEGLWRFQAGLSF